MPLGLDFDIPHRPKDQRHVTVGELEQVVDKLHSKIDTLGELFQAQMHKLTNLFQVHINCEAIDRAQTQQAQQAQQQGYNEHPLTKAFEEIDKLDQAASTTSVIHASDFAKKVNTILEERGKIYDSPRGERSMEKIVDVFYHYTGHALTETQGWLFMDVLKTVRALQKNSFHKDSYEDKVSYSCLMAEAASKER